MKRLGVILAGGQSSRMGTDKAMVMLGGQSLLSHSIARLGKQINDIAVNCNHTNHDWQGVYIRDVYDTQMGPLLGVLSALRYARAKGFERVLSIPVDAPFFPDDLVARLCEKPVDIVLASCDHPNPKYRLHPAFGCWNVSLHDRLDVFLSAGGRKVMQFVQECDWTSVQWSLSAQEAFFNINTPDDLAQAEKRLG